LFNQSTGRDELAPTRYGGIVASTREFRSRHIHAVSVNASTRPYQFGVAHSAGHPDHGDGLIVERGHAPPGPSSTNASPFGSPGVAAFAPTDAGGTTGLSFGVTGVSSRHAARFSTIVSPEGVVDGTDRGC
jgi:hypothetical protein